MSCDIGPSSISLSMHYYRCRTHGVEFSSDDRPVVCPVFVADGRARSEEADELRSRVLAWRGVETPCPECQGAGSKAYGSTATWRGGVGGASITTAVCDKCWGSGDKDHPWANLRKLEGRLRRLEDALWDAQGGKQPGCVCDPADLYICDGTIDRCRGEEKKA